VLRPIFPGYLFVAVNLDLDLWRPIASTFGVRKLLHFGDNLGLLDDRFIGELKAREVNGAVVRPAAPYQVGQSVRITDGAFAGIVTRIIALNDSDRVTVLLDLLGKATKAKFDVRDISPA
jgi:transcriptional antiterminator RfaH